MTWFHSVWFTCSIWCSMSSAPLLTWFPPTICSKHTIRPFLLCQCCWHNWFIWYNCSVWFFSSPQKRLSSYSPIYSLGWLKPECCRTKLSVSWNSIGRKMCCECWIGALQSGHLSHLAPHLPHAITCAQGKNAVSIAQSIQMQHVIASSSLVNRTWVDCKRSTNLQISLTVFTQPLICSRSTWNWNWQMLLSMCKIYYVIKYLVISKINEKGKV